MVTKERVDDFYPQLPEDLSYRIGKVMGLVIRIEEHTRNASAGDREAESRLANRIGSVRRSFPDPRMVPDQVREAVQSGIAYLRLVGRKVNFGETDPRLWITQRDGSPRW